MGLNFPLGSKIEEGGLFAGTTDETTVRSSIKQLMQTERGERVMLPEFGTNLRRFLFQPLDETTFQSIKREIQSNFDKYIVGAIITKIKVYPLGDIGPSGGNSLKVALDLELNSRDFEVFDVEVNLS